MTLGNIKEVREALDVLSAQVGNARLRKMWSKPINDFLDEIEGRYHTPQQEAQACECDRIPMSEVKDDE
jgi:thymidine phosphorylase